MAKTQRWIVVSDLHCGQYAGLTPPAWQKGSGPLAESTLKLRKECWKWYRSMLRRYKGVDGLFVLGDCIDGNGYRNSGVELLTTDRLEQADMATFALQQWEAPSILMVNGTCSHTGQSEQYENIVADKLGADISAHEWATINGVTFDLKHSIGGSAIPHGRHTAIAKDRLWNKMWSDNELQPDADVYLRGHVHYHSYCGGPGWLAMTLPPLQAAATRFGALKCSGLVDYGITVFDINADGSYSWHTEIAQLQQVAAQAKQF